MRCAVRTGVLKRNEDMQLCMICITVLFHIMMTDNVFQREDVYRIGINRTGPRMLP